MLLCLLIAVDTCHNHRYALRPSILQRSQTMCKQPLLCAVSLYGFHGKLCFVCFHDVTCSKCILVGRIHYCLCVQPSCVISLQQTLPPLCAVLVPSLTGQSSQKVFPWGVDFPAASLVHSFSLSIQTAAGACTIVPLGCTNLAAVFQMCSCLGPLMSTFI